MTSLYEPAPEATSEMFEKIPGEKAEASVALAFGKRNISRLEFPALGEVVSTTESREEVAIPKDGGENESSELKAKIAALEEENLKRVLEERERVRMEERAALERHFEEGRTEDRVALARLQEEFRLQRRRYFEDVESEVVRLALAIATRIVHREVLLDPALLSGAVHVALKKVEEGSAVKLRVPESDLTLWENAFQQLRNDAFEVVGDCTMNTGECVLETTLGRADLGVKAQLEEIERGFFDLLERRPS